MHYTVVTILSKADAYPEAQVLKAWCERGHQLALALVDCKSPLNEVHKGAWGISKPTLDFFK